MLTLAMIAVNQRQADLALANSASNANDARRILDAAHQIDQHNVSINGKLETLEQYLIQMPFDRTHFRTRPILTPTLLRSALESKQDLDQATVDAMRRLRSLQEPLRPRCSCDHSSQAALFKRVYANVMAYSGICEVHKKSGTTILLLKQRIFWQWVLRLSLEVSFSSTNGAGGFSISPKIEFRAIVPVNSQIFGLLLGARKGLESQEVSLVIKDIQKKVFETFREGKASPSDALGNSDTILHMNIDLPEELQPLIYKSEHLLILQLRRGKNLQRWIESYTRWPAGLALLLRSGHTPIDGTLIAACEANCEESVKILVSDGRCHIGSEELEMASYHHNLVITDLIFQALVDRRKRLQTLAVTSLPKGVVGQLRIGPNTLLNLQAYEAYTLLEASSVDLGGLLERYSWSVFDCIGTNLDLADQLWNAGFRDVDAVNGNDTCLTRLWRSTPPCSLDIFLRKAHWLISKGADINHQVSSSPSLHVLGNAVGRIIHYNSENVALEMRSLSETSKQLMLQIFLDNTQDGCCCACSLDGCSSLTTFLDGLFPTLSHGKMKELVQALAITLKVLADPPSSESQKQLINQLGPSILRFLTFRALDITHTCMHDGRKIEAEEIQEIHDEEKHSILRLEDLLAILLQQSKIAESFPEFLTDTWWMHVNAILTSSETYSQEDLSRILEMGVVLYSC
ncbi:hypothetical protein N7512_001836 [Penicillium capsulatum]|nr:hypothetical protein N7512_001836 [Penicillium capsulatum]